MTTTYTAESVIRTQKKTRGITLKVTETFYQRCREQAGETPLGEWARCQLEAHLARGAEHRLMEELWAFRYIVLNGFLTLVVDESDRAEALRRLQSFSDEADRRKPAKASALLNATG